MSGRTDRGEFTARLLTHHSSRGGRRVLQVHHQFDAVRAGSLPPRPGAAPCPPRAGHSRGSCPGSAGVDARRSAARRAPQTLASRGDRQRRIHRPCGRCLQAMPSLVPSKSSAHRGSPARGVDGDATTGCGAERCAPGRSVAARSCSQAASVTTPALVAPVPGRSRGGSRGGVTRGRAAAASRNMVVAAIDEQLPGPLAGRSGGLRWCFSQHPVHRILRARPALLTACGPRCSARGGE